MPRTSGSRASSRGLAPSIPAKRLPDAALGGLGGRAQRGSQAWPHRRFRRACCRRAGGASWRAARGSSPGRSMSSRRGP
eukprot:1935920-Alexandrium_andersonii.AAC.1